MVGCALAAREGGLISLSLVFDAVPLKAKKVIATLSSIISFIFYVIVVKTGFDKVAQMIASDKRTSILLWPEWIFMLFLPVGAILLILHSFEYLMKIYSLKEDPNKKAEEKEEAKA